MPSFDACFNCKWKISNLSTCSSIDSGPIFVKSLNSLYITQISTMWLCPLISSNTLDNSSDTKSSLFLTSIKTFTKQRSVSLYGPILWKEMQVSYPSIENGFCSSKSSMSTSETLKTLQFYSFIMFTSNSSFLKIPLPIFKLDILR